MVSKDFIEKQLKDLGLNSFGWGRGEYDQLPNIILPDEEIYEVVNGIYEGGFALLLATDIRVLLVDKKPFSFLTVEDLRFDMINEIDYNHRMFGAYITVTTGNKVLNFRSYNKERLRKLIGHVQHCMAETKKQQTTHAEGQAQHLEKINEQLQAYLMAQHSQQQKLQDHLVRLQTGLAGNLPQMPAPVEPSPELKDYLYSRGLLERYRQDNSTELPNQPAPPSPTASTNIDQPAQAEQQSQALPADSQLTEIYADGLQEVYGNNKRVLPAEPQSGGSAVIQNKPAAAPTSSLEVNPIRIAYSKLPMVLRNRKFGLGLSGISKSSLRPPMPSRPRHQPKPEPVN